MTGQQDDGDGLAGDDVLEQGRDRRSAPSWWPSWPSSPGPSWWPPRISRPAAIVSLVALVLGLGVGYLAGSRHTGGNPAPASAARGRPSAQPVAAAGPTLEQSGNRCSAQYGTTLQLGIEVSNQSATPMTLGRIRVLLPLGGLRVTAVSWGPCGELPKGSQDPPGNDTNDRYLPPGGSTWLTVAARVLVACPQPLPVQFAVGYVQHGRYGRTILPGFSDLASVTYSGCRS